ncbi:MAG: mechanosensitive ion channel family protein [Deltaproteobacteria bacterium]|nr:mechanosensitive ion channel family protein [Deltaproteobacteria bacterium]
MKFLTVFLLAVLLCLPLAHTPVRAQDKPPTLKQVIAPEQKAKKANGKPDEAAPQAKPPQASDANESPRSVLVAFVQAARRGDYKAAAEYLDLSAIPPDRREELGPRLAYRLKAAGARKLWLELEALSADARGNLADNLPPDLEKIGSISTPQGSVDLTLHRLRGPKGRYLWRFTPRTVSQIDLLYQHHGHGLLGEKLTEYLPDRWILGMQLWQWAAMLILIVLCYLAAWLLTAVVERLLARRAQGISAMGRHMLRGPLRLLVAALLFTWWVDVVGPSMTLQAIMKGHTVLLLALLWCLVVLVDLSVERLTLHMHDVGNQQSTVLLKPVGTIVKVLLVLTFGMVWLDNLGFKVTTILASLGVGGLAVALAAQDTLKNFIGSIVILLDKPFRVGERIVVKGHDGFVEEIGLRSVKLRQLDGHQAVVPNELVVTGDVENIGRRPHIRRLSFLGIAYDTPPEKAQRAVEIIQEILTDHEGSQPDMPPRVYLNEFSEHALQIMMIYWYHPADFWAFQAFNQKVNLEIMRRFAAEGIRLAYPTRTAFLASDPERPLRVETVPSETSPD